ncbi:hypothetical protein [Algibacter sp. L4_22]|uniref:capsular polysaccharide export protein, LipB/KpsS family n=1 Tax=Algibacter sp. L4_22 TaxID=2942477 RepID=UPI00201B53B1|nr:hypothetical protein [Algibacter sp. L4_22]MCL5127256.1 hypothetical protein [Algibacter sp. L4_22]
MNILFIENRYKTYTFEAVANLLKKEGHHVFFLIQNKDYTPKSDFSFFEIPFPKKEDLIKSYKVSQDVENVIASDRMQNFFKKKGTSYFYYYNKKIEEVLDSCKPDFVFGESTAFHELLTINNCKKKGVLYLHPSSCRYPKNRFAFYKYNTLEPYKGSNEDLSETEALTIINNIVDRSAKPDYMNVIKAPKLKGIKDKIRKVKSFIGGDSYNTPNPIVKYNREKIKQKNIIDWDNFAEEKINKGNNFIILYPLQMQPEANIDVWGLKYRNQLQLIGDICNRLPENVKLVVKPNPKSKYELSKDLVDYVQNNSDIIALQHAVKMDDILVDLDLVVTVTGTIAIESILSNIPVITLVKTLNNEQENCKFIDNLDQIIPIIKLIQQKQFPKIDNTKKIAYLNRLNKTSYEGRVSDPFSFAGCFSEKNLTDILSAFKHVINN